MLSTHIEVGGSEGILPQGNFENRFSEMASESYFTCKASFSILLASGIYPGNLVLQYQVIQFHIKTHGSESRG